MIDKDDLSLLNRKIDEINYKLLLISNVLNNIESKICNSSVIDADYNKYEGSNDGYIFDNSRIIKAKFAGTAGTFAKMPNMIILHSGVKNEGVAEWFKNPLNRNGTYRKCWTHFAYSNRIKQIAQCDSLLNRGQHVGPFWNDCSYGIELPGPYNKEPRSDHEKNECLYTIERILKYNPFIQFITCHKFVETGNRDPGNGVKKEWFDELGLTIIWSKEEALEYKKCYFKYYSID